MTQLATEKLFLTKLQYTKFNKNYFYDSFACKIKIRSYCRSICTMKA